MTDREINTIIDGLRAIIRANTRILEKHTGEIAKLHGKVTSLELEIKILKKRG